MSSETAQPTRAPRPGVAFVLVNTAMIWLTTAIAAITLWPVYRSPEFVVLVAVTLLVGSAIAVLGALFRWRAWLVALATVLVYGLLGVPLAIPSATVSGVLPTLDGLQQLAQATALSWKQLLTITLPVGSYQALLVPLFILVLLTSVLGLTTALRARRGELGVIAPVAFFILAIALGPTTATLPLQLALGLLAVVLLWLVWWRWQRRRQALAVLGDDQPGRRRERGFFGLRTFLSALLILAIAGGAAVAATLLAPPVAPREVIRSSIVQPFDPRSYPSPLSGFREYEKAPQKSATMLRVTGLPSGGRIRIATLDDYDGVVYSVGSESSDGPSASFSRVPYTFDQSAVRGSTVKLGVTVEDYSGVWLPTVGQFESVQFTGSRASALRDSFYYNDNSGTAAVVRPLQRGDAYTLTAVLRTQPSTDRLASLTPGHAELPRIAVLPDQLSSVLDEYVKSATSPGARLVAMIAALKQNGYISHGVSKDEPFSRSGHAADRVTQLLSDQRMIGDQEQYAVTAALMARQLGFPARVVFGFQPTEARGTTIDIHGGDVSAWIEVDTARYGWVAIDPTPPIREIPPEQPQDPQQIARPQSPVQPPVVEPDKRDTQVPQDGRQQTPAEPDAFLLILFAVLRVVGWVVLAIAVILSPFLAIIGAKHRRRTLRRRAASPELRIRGGWQEFEDAVLDHGFTPPPSPTRIEVATAVGGMQPLVLASVADRAVFAPSEPDAAEADQVWRSVQELRASLDSGLTRWQRIRVLISLRSLGGYSVKKLFKR